MTLIYFSEKYEPDANPFVYYPKAMSTSQNSVSVARAFYQGCVGLLTSHSELTMADKGCGVNIFNIAVQADGAGLLGESGIHLSLIIYFHLTGRAAKEET